MRAAAGKIILRRADTSSRCGIICHQAGSPPQSRKKSEGFSWRIMRFAKARRCGEKYPSAHRKNAVLPIMCGALLTGEDARIERVPELTDVKTLCALLASCGCSVKKENDALILNAAALQNPQDEEDVRKMRASVLVLGPLLARLGEARIPLPGGLARSASGPSTSTSRA